MNLRKKLLTGEAKLAIWGAGYIGYSNAMHFAKHSVSSILVDIDEKKVKLINDGEPPYKEIKTWLGFDISPFTHLVTATSNWKQAHLCPVHFIAVNTEKDAKPWDAALRNVCSKIVKCQPRLIIVESTLAPGWTDSIVMPMLGSQAQIAIAPRRDWFTLQDKSLEVLDRIVGASSEEALKEAIDVLSIVSRKIHVASNYRIAELVKSVENAIRHLGIAFSYQLALAYPNLDVREILRLCATKWNIDLYQPSIGIGGYCLPLSPQYVLSGTTVDIPILRNAVYADFVMPKVIANEIAHRKLTKVCILGLAYKGNLKVHVSSPSIRLAKELKAIAIDVGVNDPLYSNEEIVCLSDCYPVPFPSGLRDFDCIILACDHDEYKAIRMVDLFNSLSKCKLILDCFGLWFEFKHRFSELGIEYHAVGDAGWLQS